MPTLVKTLPIFEKRLARLERKYPKALDEVLNLIEQLEQDHRPGDKVPGLGFDVYKTRLRNPATQRGKSGGFRVIYYVQLANDVTLLTIYSKTEQTDLSSREISQLVAEATLPNDQHDGA